MGLYILSVLWGFYFLILRIRIFIGGGEGVRGSLCSWVLLGYYYYHYSEA